MNPFAAGNPVQPTLLETPATSAGAFVGSRPILTPGPAVELRSPIDGQLIATCQTATAEDLRGLVEGAGKAFEVWKKVPPAHRGELLRLIAAEVRRHRADLASVITLEVGKIAAEAAMEVQQAIESFEFAAGLSRQMQGMTMASQVPGRRMLEQYHPLGPVGIITAFNFPVAVYGWNAAMALLCGDPVIWKPSEKASLSAVALHHLVSQAAVDFKDAPEGLCSLVRGGAEIGQALAGSEGVPLICATGSVGMGRGVAAAVGQRLGRTLLELGGNNALILAPSADRGAAVKAIVQSATATAGQRCTTLRRLIVHHSIRREVVEELRAIYGRLHVGDPRLATTEVGPLIDGAAVRAFEQALEWAQHQGGRVVCGGRNAGDAVPAGGHYVRPALVEIPSSAAIVGAETFAPILYIDEYATLEQAMAMDNGVSQGLCSALFTRDLAEAEQFISSSGAASGLAHVNQPTVGVELGMAFGGDKQTGGGREFAADCWKQYVRRMATLWCA